MDDLTSRLFFRLLDPMFRMSRFCCLLSLVLLIVGCQSTYQETKIGNNPTPVLRNDTRVYVASPPDAIYKKKVVDNSGKQVAGALLDAFSKHTKGAYMGKNPESVNEALETARKISARYLIYPHILKWEDHTTEYTGIRDKMGLRIDVVDTESGSVVYAREITAKSRWMSDGEDAPQDLLGDPTDHFAAMLFRTVDQPTSLH
jgi:hypothetical protein